jgi:hypothetical protein
VLLNENIVMGWSEANYPEKLNFENCETVCDKCVIWGGLADGMG